MKAALDLAGFEWAEARVLELRMWVTETRLNLSNFERAAARLRSSNLKQMVMLAAVGWDAAVARPESNGLERGTARLRFDDFE